MTIREATPEDNEGLLSLTRATPMRGSIALRIDREPDFFKLLRMRGAPTVMVATSGGRVVGCISAARRDAFVCGEPGSVAYIGDLKVHPAHSGGRLALRLIQALRRRLCEQDADLLFCLVAAGNRRAISLLQGRAGTPRWRALGSFRVCQMLPWPLAGRSAYYEIGFGRCEDVAELLELASASQRERQFAAVPTREQLVSDLGRGGAGENRVLVARSGGRIVASVALVDASAAKKNVVLAMPSALRGAVAVLNGLSLLIPRWDPPRLGQALRILFLRYPVHAPDHERAVVALIRRARVVAFRERYTFLTLGLHESDPLSAVLRGIPRLTFVSEGFAMSLHDRSLDSLVKGIPVEDYALA